MLKALACSIEQQNLQESYLSKSTKGVSDNNLFKELVTNNNRSMGKLIRAMNQIKYK